MLQGANVVGIEMHGLLDAGLLLPYLLAEALGLVFVIVEPRTADDCP
jgi:hypothetical protein